MVGLGVGVVVLEVVLRLRGIIEARCLVRLGMDRMDTVRMGIISSRVGGDMFLDLLVRIIRNSSNSSSRVRVDRRGIIGRGRGRRREGWVVVRGRRCRMEMGVRVGRGSRMGMGMGMGIGVGRRAGVVRSRMGAVVEF
ncbi:hypothetical protein CVT24_012067 [Panaeolus cyanescens]|uniref:Uncharacterized protein n=1 Tax=Panaeolus cyanescens TaxID=181874 RepID=A0A409VHV7_9AGAR|nr:hypothetical protein CVT24_012067 [Panaeolus cyanescens]